MFGDPIYSTQYVWAAGEKKDSQAKTFIKFVIYTYMMREICIHDDDKISCCMLHPMNIGCSCKCNCIVLKSKYYYDFFKYLTSQSEEWNTIVKLTEYASHAGILQDH